MIFKLTITIFYQLTISNSDEGAIELIIQIKKLLSEATWKSTFGKCNAFKKNKMNALLKMYGFFLKLFLGCIRVDARAYHRLADLTTHVSIFHYFQFIGPSEE